MAKLILIYNFLLTGLFALAGLLHAKSLNQALFALLFLPLTYYFFRRLVSSSPNLLPTTTYLLQGTLPQNLISPNFRNLMPSSTPVDGEELSEVQVSDINRRLFLKLIGTAGLTTFLFALFTKSSQAAFFGSMPGPGTVALKDSHGKKIDPAEKGPTDGYEISEVDDSGIPAYYGFVNVDGAWYISKEGAGGEYRYIKGNSDFATVWTDRASQIYDYFNNIF